MLTANTLLRKPDHILECCFVPRWCDDDLSGTQYFHSLVLLQNGTIRLDHILPQKNYLPLSIFSKDRKKGGISFWSLVRVFFPVLTAIVQFLLWRLVAPFYFLWFLLQTRFLWFLLWRIKIANKKPQEWDLSRSEFAMILLSSTTFPS